MKGRLRAWLKGTLIIFFVVHLNNAEERNYCQSFVNPLNCVWKGPPKFNITADKPCIFNCSYNPKSGNAIELDVHQLSSISQAQVFVSARQNYQFTAWTLPIIFPEHGFDQPYNSIEAILCPPRDNTTEILFFRVETNKRPIGDVDVVVNVSLKSQRLQLQSGYNVTVKPTPVSPWYKLYEWEAGVKSVLVDAYTKVGGKICALLSLQDAQCPVGLKKESIIAGKGRYQSFQERGAIVARKEVFPHGVFIVLLPLADDSMCTGVVEESGNKTSRHKSVVLTVLPHTTISGNWGIYVATSFVLGMIIFGSTIPIIMCIQRNLNPRNPEFLNDGEEESLLSDEENAVAGSRLSRTVAMGGVQVVFGAGTVPNSVGRSNDSSSGVGNPDREVDGERPSARMQGIEERLREIMAGEANVTSSGDIVSVYPTNLVPELFDQSLPQDIVNVTNESNPRFVYWWKAWAEYKDQKKETNIGVIGFQRNMIIVAVFMALPFVEILKSYLNAFANQGSEDQCFFNSRCITSFWIFSDFSRVFTNIAYLFSGITFMYIVKKHRMLNWKISAGETLGVSRNYGLFTSLGIGLIIQALMSSMYHLCPNSVTLRLDLMFMYVDAVVLIVGVWGLRHGGVSHHVYPTVGLVGVALLGAEFQEFVTSWFFWLVVMFAHVTLTVTIGAMLWKYGTWSFSPLDMINIWKKWKPIAEKLNGVLLEESSTNASIVGCFRMSLGVILNLVIVVCCWIFNIEVYMYILIVCIANMVMYVANYISAKLLEKEKGTIFSWICFACGCILWIFAITFFFIEDTDTESMPSVSRALNYQCILFGVFDYHDLWHILSALAMFCTFVGLLTLDDDLARRNPQKIPVV